MNFFISSDFRTSTSALIPSLFSLPSFTAMTLTYFLTASESEVSTARASSAAFRPASRA